MDAAHQLDKAITGDNGRAFLAGSASRNMGLDGSLRVLIEGAQGKRRQFLKARMSFGDSHRSLRGKGDRGSLRLLTAWRSQSCHESEKNSRRIQKTISGGSRPAVSRRRGREQKRPGRLFSLKIIARQGQVRNGYALG
jgi:hypothetical protein